MRYIKYLAIVLIITGIASSYFYFSHSINFIKKSSATIISNLQEIREIDKFYTGIYHIPLIDLERGYLKRDMIKEGVKAYFNPFTLYEKGRRLINDEPLIQGDEGKNVVKGCCSKKYEVAVGYDHLMKILENESLIENICKGDSSKLPEPEILAVNCKSTTTLGKYDSTGACYAWDSNEEQRKKIIRQVMKDYGILKQVEQRGKESLKNLITAFCL